MVTQAYISGLVEGGRFFPEVDRAEITAGLLAALEAGLPDWDDPPTDALLYRALPYIAEYIQTKLETDHAQLLRGLLATAQGPDLDVIGLGPPVVLRRTGEADDDYRLRIATAHAAFARGTIEGVEYLASTFNTAIADVRAYVSPNRQDLRVFPIGENVTQLATEARTMLQAYLASRENAIAGVTVTVAEPTVQQYRIRAAGRYDPTLYASTEVTALMRTSLQGFIRDNQLVGRTVYESVLIDAARVPELRDVTAQFVRPTSGNTFPDGDDGAIHSGNLVASAQFTAADIYTAALDDTGVQITVAEI